MPDEPMAEEGPFGLGNPSDQILFDLFGLSVRAEPQSLGKTGHMGVDDDARFDAEGIPQDHVGGLPTHTVQGDQGVHRARHLASMLFHERATARLDVAGLVAVQADAADVVREGLRIGAGVIGRRPVFPEELLGDDVDLLEIGRASCRERVFRTV